MKQELQHALLTSGPIVSGFTEFLGHLSDPRSPQGRRHSLFSILAAACSAMLAGRKTFSAIWSWIRHAPTATLRAIGCRYVEGRFIPPSYNTIRRVLGAVFRALE
ncbi:transposase family protein [Salininema proteolyticum]|uniref:Transposase family protein n=1 Tax=Salininema proteolyticum TaxID=1607685 RepID=A0ABV8U2D9_9ACTN